MVLLDIFPPSLLPSSSLSPSFLLPLSSLPPPSLLPLSSLPSPSFLPLSLPPSSLLLSFHPPSPPFLLPLSSLPPPSLFSSSSLFPPSYLPLLYFLLPSPLSHASIILPNKGDVRVQGFPDARRGGAVLPQTSGRAEAEGSAVPTLFHAGQSPRCYLHYR